VSVGGALAVDRLAWAVEDEGDQASYFNPSAWVLVTSDLTIYRATSSKTPIGMR
jgi:hypothetical protein